MALVDESRTLRKRNGVYYTPPRLVEYVVRHTLGPALTGRTPDQIAGLRVLDPACGDGAFLRGAYEFLLAWYGAQHGRPLTPAERGDVLRRHIFGGELDGRAAETARRALAQKADEGERGRVSAPSQSPAAASNPFSGRLRDPARRLTENIRVGNALVAPEFASVGVTWDGPFDVVLGNPPWGQKAVCKDADLKRYLWQRYPSSAGIFDLFRPFVELGVSLTTPGGRFGMVLPDVVLLKDYAPTRRLLLDHLALERIDWWGLAFAGATIDAATIIGRKGPAAAGHRVAVAVHNEPPLAHTIPQADFRANPRHVFNLHLTAERRHVLRRLEGCPRLGDFFEVHEGVHSGNLRAELFVPAAVDATCRPLLFGRDEIVPYQLRWAGRYVRLGAAPARKTRERYANLGRPEWYARAKVLVRRTGDRVLAAVDREGRYASNNFFLVFPKRASSLDLDGLCALLNSRLLTWYFRTVEPRRGRAFAELKIKHLRVFPLPPAALQPDGCRRLNELGLRRREGPGPDAAVDAEVVRLFDLGDLAGRIE